VEGIAHGAIPFASHHHHPIWIVVRLVTDDSQYMDAIHTGLMGILMG
jgi:hypothetical protein